MFNLAGFSCRHHFDVRFSLIAEIGLHNVRFVPEADINAPLRDDKT